MRDWLIRLRGEKSQGEIATAVGISQQGYSLIERGLRCPSVPLAKRIGKELNCDWQQFYCEETNPDSQTA